MVSCLGAVSPPHLPLCEEHSPCFSLTLGFIEVKNCYPHIRDEKVKAQRNNTSSG